VDHRGDVLQVEVLEQAPRLGDVLVVRVPVEVDGLVRSPERRLLRSENLDYFDGEE